MSLIVDRTCTEIEMDSDGLVRLGDSKPLGGFRSTPAYVLLGDPGAGKTTEFGREAEMMAASGERAEYVKARDFVTLHIDSHPEWHGSVLFIDGLDEIRSGLVDSRPPLDEIRSRLEQLRPLGFRVSCREADWLGHNDRQNLAVVSRDSRITVVRLDPLDHKAVGQMLAQEIPDSEIQDFMENALSWDIWDLLENPLTLQLLVEAISQEGGWPQSRRETFEMACEKSATEQNQEHLIPATSESSTALMDAAGYLCALQLLSGLEGYSLQPGLHDPSFWALGDLDETVLPIPKPRLRRALATRLFTADDETGFLPRHRQLAEFLGGRYLAKLVRDGLPARRVTALMTAPSDGRVATALRGLSAWLAAHSAEARSLLIDSDPVGVGLYGDISGFSTRHKKHLLTSLATFATQGALLGYGWRRLPNGGYGDETAWAFRSLVSEEMVPALEDLLKRSGDEPTTDRVLEFVLQVLSNAENTDLGRLETLVPEVEAILWDPGRPSRIRQAALEAYIRVAPPGDTKTLRLRVVLDAVHNRTIPDPDDQLAGTLLRHLYPNDLPPAEVWQYAGPRNSHRDMRSFWGFWDRVLLRKSSHEQIAGLLDALYENSSDIVPVLQDSGFEDLPVRLLAQGLRAIGDDIHLSRLYQWLTATVPPLRWRRTADEDVDYVRTWLDDRPQIQKAMVLGRLKPNDNPYRFASYRGYAGDVLHNSRLPADFGIWCLDQAIQVAATDPDLSQTLLKESFYSLRDPKISRGLTLELMQERVSGLAALERQLQELDASQSSATSANRGAPWRKEMEELREQQLKETKKRRDDWAHHLRTQETELRANTFPPHNLHYLALVYLAEGSGVYPSPPDRIEDLVGDDRRLVEAVMAALRGGLWRDDVPDLDETISLRSQAKMPYLAHPVLASMDLLFHEPDHERSIDRAQMRRALGIYYHWGQLARDAQACHDAWLQQDPDLVFDVLYRCAVAALRNGDETLPGVYDLDRVTGNDDLVSNIRLRLLEAFPTRLPNKQMQLLDDLLEKTLRYVDNTRVTPIAKKKLTMRSLSVAQRVRWMTVDALLSGGQHTQQFRAYVGANERRIRHLAEFLHHTSVHTARETILRDSRDSELLVNLVEMLGRSYGPQDLDGQVTVEKSTSDLIGGLISQLSAAADSEARHGLARLVADPQLRRWNNQLTWAQEKQRIVYRDVSYSHPNIRQTQRALGNRAPANAADLAALLRDRLKDIADHIRGDNTNPWRQFWNEDPHGRLIEGKPENSCRDVLLESLKERLPQGVDAAPEGSYAADKRADIRTTFDRFNVPTEIKKNAHRDLWSAIRSQLIDQYTTDPETSGYGIYLVLWFGANQTQRPPNGTRPNTPDELAQQLENELTTDETRKITVIVIDVTKPS